MNSYQIVMPNGDFMKVAADRMENVDGDLKFFQGNTVVGEARYWQAWSLIGTIDDTKSIKSAFDLDQEIARIANTPRPDDWKATL